MADEQQLALIKQGPRVWNEWRERTPSTWEDLIGADVTSADLTGADLRGANLTIADLTSANLTSADLSHADLSHAKLPGAKLPGVKLRRANLTGADLTAAELSGANLARASLPGADVTGAFLRSANLTRAGLAGANLTGAHCFETVLADLDLSQALGLESLIHEGPSAVDHRTLEQSGRLPLSFLRGCGLPDRLIDYLPSLLNAGSIQFFSVFISYSTANEAFAKRLHADLQDHGVRCWFAPHDMQGGKNPRPDR